VLFITFYEYLLTVKREKDSFGPFLQMFVYLLTFFLQLSLSNISFPTSFIKNVSYKSCLTSRRIQDNDISLFADGATFERFTNYHFSQIEIDFFLLIKLITLIETICICLEFSWFFHKLHNFLILENIYKIYVRFFQMQFV